MENRIKEQLDLFADRTLSLRWWTNQYRVTLAAVAYTLLKTVRRTALRGTHLARAQSRTLRLRVLKLGAVVTRNTRTVAVQVSSTCPDQAVFRLLVHRLTAGWPAASGRSRKKASPGSPGPARYARGHRRGSKTISRDRLNCSEAPSQAISVRNMRREMPHYVQTTKNSPFMQYPR